MALDDLRNKNCIVCHKRGDYVKKGYLVEIKNDEKVKKLKLALKLEKDPKVGDICCKSIYSSNT